MRIWLVVALLAGCAAPTDEDVQEDPDLPEVELPEVREMYVVATDMSYRPQSVWQFYPAAISAASGEAVNMTFKSAGGNSYPHTLVIDELDIRLSAPTEFGTESIEFEAPAGTYTYYCDVENHRLLGMEGTFTVS